MKKILSVIISLALTSTFILTNAVAEDKSYLIFGGNDYVDGIGQQTDWGIPDGLSYDNPVEGEASWDFSNDTDFSIDNPSSKLMFFYNLPKPEDSDIYFDATQYENIECDIRINADDGDVGYVCGYFEFCLVGDFIAHHGNDWELTQRVVFPSNEWVHFKMPVSEFIERSPANPDLYDAALAAAADDIADVNEMSPPHYCPDITNVHRIRIQFHDCTDENRDPFEYMVVSFDNIKATSGNEGEPSNWKYESDYFEQDPSSNTSSEAASSTPDSSSDESSSIESSNSESSQPSGLKGDVDGDGVVTATDALLTLQASVGKVELTDNQKLLADVDGAEGLSATDALMILQASVGKIQLS